MGADPTFPPDTRIAKLTRLVEVSLVLNSTLELEPLLRHIMDAAAELADSASASILLMDDDTQQLQFMAFPSGSEGNIGQTLRRIPVPLRNSVAGTCLLENRPIAINDVSDNPTHFRKADDTSGFQTRSLLAIPMRRRDGVIGVLEAVNKHGNLVWTEGDIFCLEILAAQAAVAIENSSLVSRLRHAYDDLSQLDKLKNDFIAIASHELRTPLGVVLGYASFIKEEASGESLNHATLVVDAAMKMKNVVEDMTNLRLVSVGESELNREPTPAAEMMLTALEAVQPKAAAKGHKLNYTPPPPDVMLLVDQMLLPIALASVLDNAIKFSPEGSFVEVSYQLNEGELWFTILDQGVGLQSSQFERIFNAFYQVEDHMTRRQGGMGLGLAITKAVIEAHHGRVWVRSAGLNLGATFYLSLPLAPNG